MFYSVQGEGKNVGEFSLFTRFFSCQKNCDFCDSKIKTDNIEWEGSALKLSEWVLKELEEKPVKTLVITGGEPLLWNSELIQFIDFIKRDIKIGINIQTNGELLDVAREIGDKVFWSFSPKFLSAGKDNMIEKKKLLNIFSFLSEFNGELKLVIEDIDFPFIDEIVPILRELDNVVFQPCVGQQINSVGELSNMMNFQKYAQLYKRIYDRYNSLINAKFIPQIHKFINFP